MNDFPTESVRFSALRAFAFERPNRMTRYAKWLQRTQILEHERGLQEVARQNVLSASLLMTTGSQNDSRVSQASLAHREDGTAQGTSVLQQHEAQRQPQHQLTFAHPRPLTPHEVRVGGAGAGHSAHQPRPQAPGALSVSQLEPSQTTTNVTLPSRTTSAGAPQPASTSDVRREPPPPRIEQCTSQPAPSADVSATDELLREIDAIYSFVVKDRGLHAPGLSQVATSAPPATASVTEHMIPPSGVSRPPSRRRSRGDFLDASGIYAPPSPLVNPAPQTQFGVSGMSFQSDLMFLSDLEQRIQ